MRFDDGGMISLQLQTEFRIDEYHFSSRTTGRKGFFSLIRAACARSPVSSAIAIANAYKVTTSVATIGIRNGNYIGGLRRRATAPQHG